MIGIQTNKMVKVEHYYSKADDGVKVSILVFDTEERITAPQFKYLDDKLRDAFFLPYFDAIYDAGVLNSSKTAIVYMAVTEFSMTIKKIKELEIGFEKIVKEASEFL